MIPDYLNDGFTTEPVAGIFCRPMLWSDRNEWRALATQSTELAWAYIRNGYVHTKGVDADEHQVVVIHEVCGYTSKQESTDFQDLHDSVYLQHVNPGLSMMNCQTCRTYCVDHKTGEVYIAANGLPQYLPKNTILPCESNGCAKVHWTDPMGLSNERWAKTWTHYWAFKDAPVMNSDSLFRRNAALIRWVVDYGRDRRFDPFAGGGTSRRTTNVPPEGSDRQSQNGACGNGGSCSAGTSCTSC